MVLRSKKPSTSLDSQFWSLSTRDDTNKYSLEFYIFNESKVYPQGFSQRSQMCCGGVVYILPAFNSLKQLAELAKRVIFCWCRTTTLPVPASTRTSAHPLACACSGFRSRFLDWWIQQFQHLAALQHHSRDLATCRTVLLVFSN